MYQSFFGLREKPFSITPNPRFIFLSKTHQEVFAHLLYGLQQQAGFIEITGEVGTGKTTILRALFEQLDEQDYRLALIFNPRLTVLELLRSINREFGLSVTEGSHLELTEQLNRFLLEENHAGRTPVLVIDEAQNLSSDVLEQIRLLSNLETDRDKLIQIVLVGQPELGRNLDRPELRQLNQRITVRYHLDRLDLVDTCEYVRHRLKVAECPRTDLFTPAALKEVFRLSAGLPRLINVLCDRACLVSFTEEKSQVDVRAVKQASRELQRNDGQTAPVRLQQNVFKAAIILLLFVAGAWWLMANSRQDLTPAEARVSQAPGPPVLSSSGQPAAEPVVKNSPSAHRKEMAPATKQSPAPERVQVSEKPAQQKAVKTKPSKPVQSAKVTQVRKQAIASPPVAVKVDLTAEEKNGLTAMNAVMALWQRRPLSEDRSVLLNMPKAYASRHLTLVAFQGELSQLLQLNTPVLLEFGSQDRVWWVAVVAGKANGWVVEPAVGMGNVLNLQDLETLWTGNAMLPWDDPLLVLSDEQADGRVAKIQELLIACGYRQEPANGLFDRETSKAIGRFQADHGLAIDGRTDLHTLILLYQSSDLFRVPMLRPVLKG